MSKDTLFEPSDFDYVTSGIAGYCMSDMNKEQLWVILQHVETAVEFCWAQEAQEDLDNLVNKYYN